MSGTRLERVINTHPLLLRAPAGTHYLHVFDGWMEAPALQGPWTAARATIPDLATALEAATKGGSVDLLEGGDPKDPKTRPSLAKGPVPGIHVATTPTELIVTEGEPDYAPIRGTQLLYVKNTTGNVFRDLQDQMIYVLVSGRWFRSTGMGGPWAYVPGRELPADFAWIPDDSPKENVKASVPGTPQAREAHIANSIPQTATVKRSEAKLTGPVIDGAPKMAPIAGTPLQYVVNSATPIIVVDPHSYYALQNGVWFVGTSVTGPWVVATSVPAVIYSIPPSSPVHYVTYVRVYDWTSQVVYVGYTPGYYGTYVASDGVVVYGTGYYYTPWIGTVWYGPPVTYGVAAAVTYTPWTGWAVGFGFGWAWGASTGAWAWGVHPWWGPMYGAAWGPVWCRDVGARRLGGHDGERVSPLGIGDRRHPLVGGLQRLDGERVGQPRRGVVQLPDGHAGGRPASGGRQRLHRQLRLREPGRGGRHAHGRGGVGKPGHGGERVHGPVGLGEPGSGLQPTDRTDVDVECRPLRERPLREPRRPRLPARRERGLAAAQRGKRGRMEPPRGLRSQPLAR